MIDMPRLVAMVLPRHDARGGVTIDLFRADLEPNALRRWILGAARNRPGVTSDELARAIRFAFPHLRTLDAVEEADERLIQLGRVN